MDLERWKLRTRKKIWGYIDNISPIYCVSETSDTIFCGDLSEGGKIGKNLDISTKGDKSPIFSISWLGQWKIIEISTIFRQ